MNIQKSLRKKADGPWEWSVFVWFTDTSVFADCVIRPGVELNFESEEAACKDMNRVILNLKLV